VEDLVMDKMYRVIIHYEGAVYFDVEANNEERARQLAEGLFDDMDDRELVANLADIDIDDVFEVN
jgi:hypothetical protein